MSIKLKLMVMAALPLLVLLGISGTIAHERYSKVQQMTRMQTLAALAVGVGDLVHETQRERGLTAAFLGSDRKRHQAELDTQRQATDARRAELDALMHGFDASAYATDFAESLHKALALLTALADKRRGISGGDLNAADAIGYYTQMNAAFLDAVATSVSATDESELGRRLVAYAALMKGKERAGIERAVLSNTFAKDQFGPGMFNKFLALLSAQEAYLGEFNVYAGSEARARFNQVMSDPAVAQVDAMRKIATEKAATGGFGIDAGAWFATITRKIDQLKLVEDFLSEQVQAQVDTVRRQALTQLTIVSVVSLAVVLGVAVVSVLILRSILTPLHRLVQTITQVHENNDLTLRVKLDRRDEMGKLSNSFDTLLDAMNQIIAQIGRISQEVAAAATQVAASSEELSQGMAEQAQEVRQISAAVEQLSAQAQQMASRSHGAADDAEQAGHTAEQGGQVVEQTVIGMKHIEQTVSESSAAVEALGQRGQEIGQIIAVIDDIADQTNLLALNAAIEAARAGEHGRGFAVVADEVRKLADRTTQATGEVSRSIQGVQQETGVAVTRMQSGVQDVQRGVETANRAGESLRAILATTGELRSKIRQVADSATEQSQAAATVAGNIEKINAVTTQSRDGTQQAATAAADLSQRAEQMQALVTRFKTQAA